MKKINDSVKAKEIRKFFKRSSWKKRGTEHVNYTAQSVLNASKPAEGATNTNSCVSAYSCSCGECGGGCGGCVGA